MSWNWSAFMGIECGQGYRHGMTRTHALMAWRVIRLDVCISSMTLSDYYSFALGRYRRWYSYGSVLPRHKLNSVQTAWSISHFHVIHSSLVRLSFHR